MEKKIQYSDQPMRTRVVYGAVIAILILTALIVGIVAAANRKNTTPLPNGESVTKPTEDTPKNPDDGKKEEKPDVFTAPTVGRVIVGHSITVPVFSDTLKEWRVHTGIDILTEEGADVYASAAGTVSAVYADPLMGNTVEITHRDGLVTVYQNLAPELAEGIVVGKAIGAGARIGSVGDSSLSELSEEAHLHFGMRALDVAVNPLDYLTEESKRVSLSITETVSE